MDALGLLEGLVKIYSPSYHEQEAAAFLVDWMQANGYHAFCDEVGNAVGSRGDGRREIVLLGHIDTVPGFIEVRREQDLLYARGAVDAKGPLACFAAAGAQVAPPPGWRITVVGAVGEESQSHGAVYRREKHHPEALIIGEPSKWDHITLGFKGSLWVDYKVQVTMAHTASGLESAAEAAVRFWNDLVAWCASVNPPESGPFYQLTPTLREMNSSKDGFSETAGLHIGIRLPPSISPDEVISKIRGMKGAGLLEFVDPLPPFRAEKNTPLVRAFLSSVRKAGGSPVFSLKAGTSDMNVLAPAWGCPTVAYGPGDSTLDHTPNEHVSISEYLKGIAVTSEVLRQITSQA